MKELIITVARALVDNPDQVEVSERYEEDNIIYELKVAPVDLGKVIGKKGRTAKAIRTLIAASGMRSGKRTRLKILEEDDSPAEASPVADSSAISESSEATSPVADNPDISETSDEGSEISEVSE